jgi:hypothetical protein
MLIGGAPESISLPINNCVVPSGINGPVAIFVTSDDQPLNGNAQERASQAVVAGPTLAFIDIDQQTIGELVHPNNSPSNLSNNSTDAGTPPPPSVTETLSPPAASALLSSLSTSPTPLPGSSTSSGVSNNSSNGSGTPGNSGAIANGVSMIPAPAATPSAR